MLRTMGTPHARQIASALDLFADGALAPWFNGEPRVNADSPFVLFGTHKLADRLLAQGVKALLVKALMVRIAVDRYASFGSMERVPAGHYETRRRLFPMLVLLDDVRTLFIDQAPAQRDSLIESVLQIMRPALVSVVTVGIYCSDFLPGHTAAEFLEYSPFRIALLNSVDRGTARNHFFGETPANRFPAEFWHQVDSIQRPSTYSEAVVRHTSGAGLFRLIPDPFSLVLSSSNPLDQAQINDAERDGRSRLDAIRAIVAESYPSGYAATLLERVRARP